MENNLHRIEKDLRSIAKRYKSIKYSIGLAILFLMLGVSAFSEEVNAKTQVAQIATREELKTSVGDVQTKLNVLRDNNKKEIKNSIVICVKVAIWLLLLGKFETVAQSLDMRLAKRGCCRPYYNM